MASVSHLPHVFANVLVAQAAHALGDGERLPATGPSFRDATRVAGASSTIWPDIYLSNREALVALIDETAVAPRRGPRRRSRAPTVPRSSAGTTLRAPTARRCSARAWLVARSTSCAPRSPIVPGAVAEIALALGRAGINIVDIALSPARDGHQGAVALWVQR